MGNGCPCANPPGSSRLNPVNRPVPRRPKPVLEKNAVSDYQPDFKTSSKKVKYLQMRMNSKTNQELLNSYRNIQRPMAGYLPGVIRT